MAKYLRRERERLIEDPPWGIHLDTESEIMNPCVYIKGPLGTPYEGFGYSLSAYRN